MDAIGTVATLEDVLSAVDAADEGPGTGAFFDAERVLIAAPTVFARSLVDRLYLEGGDLVAAHRRRGHTVVLLSSGAAEEVRALADALGIENVVGPGGEKRADAAREFAVRHGIDLSRSHAYAGRGDAAALLDAVGTSRATNPDAQLAKIARDRKWPVLHFADRGRPDVPSLVRSLAAWGSMLPSMMGGLAVGLLNRDRHEIVQFGISTWVDRLFAITGVKLRVSGEQNLWSRRPAVFIYNHRNNLDPYVAIKLVGRDWGSVGKRELAGPLIGLMQWLTPNVAYVDRTDPAKAIESLGAVTELLRNGVSILIAPEGTRSTTGQLGVFKKGPFRMAMQARVPVVPIVIRNADRVTTRDAGIIRKGTIDVAVLPPIDVTDWTPEDLDDRIAAVRKRFADTLADWPARTRAS